MATTAAMGRLGSRRRSLANVFEIKNLNIDQHNQLKFGYSSPQTKALLERNRIRRHSEELELRWESRFHRKHPRREFRMTTISPIFGPIENKPEIIHSARWAVEEFNKQKDARLQFVRVLKPVGNQNNRPWVFHLLTLEAVDHDVLKTYQAIVKKRSFQTASYPPQLQLFGLVADDGHGPLFKLFDDRGSPFAGPFDQRSCSRLFKVRTTLRYALEDEMLNSLHIQ
ncbi:hypothetical protein M0R45_001897 [Rubus argutus]|uniref:Uncharacterized protein n=1 Tax=Rubus argutus TaxID=59490 RepID=A0AAW1VF67_RUBAR